MRRVLPLVVVLLAGADRSGHVVRVSHPAPDRVRVPAGYAHMGISEEDIEPLVEECRLALGAPHEHMVDLCRTWMMTLAARGMKMPMPGPDGAIIKGIWIDGFWIDTHEVTTAEYRACAQRGACTPAPLVTGDVRHLRGDLPIVNVTRDEANRFCQWRGGRLPTEAEWERAARGDDGRTWPWGNLPRPDDFNHGKVRSAVLSSLDQVRQRADVREFGDPDDSDGWMYAAPPGSEPWSASPYGAHDMAGNVAEWVLDDFDEDGWGGLATTNPLRTGTPGAAAMTRGGSWRDPPFAARVDVPSYQSTLPGVIRPETRAVHIGFRCVYGAGTPIEY